MQTSNRETAAERQQSLQDALREVRSIVRRCEKMKGKFSAGLLSGQPAQKFPQGSSQDSLLKNRLHAMGVAQLLLEANLSGETAPSFTREELERSVAPLDSIIHKCATAQRKWEPGTRYYRQLQRMIDAMQTAKELVCTALHALEK